MAAVVALLGVLAVYAGTEPGPLPATFHGNSLLAAVVFGAFAAAAAWVLRTARRRVWPWAAGVAVVLATAELAGLSLLADDSLTLLHPPHSLVAWVVVHWLGYAVLGTFALAALLQAVDTHVLTRAAEAPAGARTPAAAAPAGPAADAPARARGLVAALRSADRRRRRTALAVVLGLLLLSRVPYLVVWWPGIVVGDTFRAYSYARGTVPWDTYDPVGHSLLIGGEQWLGTALGLGDAGGVAIASIVQIVTAALVTTFMLARMAVWGVDRRVWAASLAWCALLPVFGVTTVTVVKDIPFATAFVLFLTCVGEIVLGGPAAARKRWPWVTLAVAAVLMIAMRNNGVHVAVLSLVVLTAVLWRHWRRMLLVLLATAIGYGLYVGPLYRALDVKPGPAVEVYSVPIQQIARIARDHGDTLTPEDERRISEVFGGARVGQLVKHYVPPLSDPMKLAVRRNWDEHSASRLLRLWADLAARYPGTAAEATLANTLGYWDPEAPSYDGLYLWSANDLRDIHLDIPSGEPTTGFRGWLERSTILPTRTYLRGQGDDGYRAIPLLGLMMSPGPVCWAWVLAAVVLVRRRAGTALALLVPPGALLATFLAGPVSGGERYSLGLFAALPLAAAVVLLARRAVRPHGGPDADAHGGPEAHAGPDAHTDRDPDSAPDTRPRARRLRRPSRPAPEPPTADDDPTEVHV